VRLRRAPCDAADAADSCGVAAPAIPRWRGLVKSIAAPHWTVAFFLLMAAGALWVAEGGANPTLATLPPLTLLVLNLLAAIVTTPRFRSDVPLLTFHLALLAFVVLLVLARLTYLDATTTLAEGATFTGQLHRESHGALHGSGLANLRFRNEALTEVSNSSDRRTHNQVRWWDGTGASYSAEIGQDRPLILDSYRIYPTRRGFVPQFLWEAANGGAEYGTVQLDYVGSDGFASAAAWQLPSGPEVWVMLDMEAVKRAEAVKRVVPGAAKATYGLILRVQGKRYELRPGESIELPGGRLTYAQLGSWVGYRITYDATMPWLVATILAGIASLVWFYAVRLRPTTSKESFQ
jgi:hypothetical protein